MSPSKRDLEEIPGVGPRIAGYLESVGVHRVADLRAADAEELYDRLCRKRGRPFDRCLLYVLRCAVYYASTPRPQSHLLKWWKWKDAALAESNSAKSDENRGGRRFGRERERE